MRHQTFDVLVSDLGKEQNKWRGKYYQKSNSKILPGAEEMFQYIISTGPLSAFALIN